MLSCARQDDVDTEKEGPNTTTERSPVAAVDNNGNLDDTPYRYDRVCHWREIGGRRHCPSLKYILGMAT